MESFHLKFMVNKTNKRYLEILHAFEKFGTASASQLSTKLGVSKRTIISDINQIKALFQDSAFISPTISGYEFKKIQNELFISQKQSFLDEEPLFTLIRGIFIGEKKDIGDWADTLYISESSLLRYLKNLAPTLDLYNLSFKYFPVKLEGKEQDIRYFFKAFFYDTEIAPHWISIPEEIETIAFKFITLTKDAAVTAIPFSELCHYMYISFERLRHDCPIIIPKQLKMLLSQDPVFLLFNELKILVSEYYKIDISEDEYLYLMLLCITSRDIENHSLEHAFNIHYGTATTQQLADEYCDYMNVSPLDIRATFIHTFFICYYLRQMLTSVNNQMMPDTLENISNIYPKEVSYNRTFIHESKIFNRLFPKKSIPSFSAALSIFIFSLDIHYVGRPHNIAFLIEGSFLTWLNVKAVANRYLGRFQNLYFINSENFSKHFLEENKIEIFVTDNPDNLLDPSDQISCVLFNTMPLAEDWNNLMNTIHPRILQQYEFSDKQVLKQVDNKPLSKESRD